ncbi:MAG: T9SS type A sorting domain-containing protein [Bacteroidia bacterium]|nr:T9SS type A sorting domain-containing protein [Bacteroidia bacterium]
MKKLITLLFISIGFYTQAQSVCFGETFTLTATNPQSLTGLSYSMNPGGVTSNSATFVFTPTASAIYTLYTTGTNTNSTQATTTFTSWVFVQALPVVTPSYTQASCSSTVNGFNFNLTFTPVTMPAYNITWNGAPPANVFGPQQYSATGGIAGGVYSCTITTSSNCTTAVTFTMLPTPSPNTMQVTKSYPLLCPGVASTLTGIPANYSYTWSTGATTSSISVSPTVTTSYSVISTNSSGCTETMSINQPVSSLPSVSLSVTQTLICLGDSTILSGSGSSSYLWNTGSTSSILKLKPTSDITYTLTGTSLDNCDSKAVVTLSVINCTGIKNTGNKYELSYVYPIPANSVLNVRLPEGYATAELRVMNALGELVYENKQCSDNSRIDLGEWPNGIYHYQISVSGKLLGKGALIKE